MENYTDLNLCKVFYMLEIYHMPDSLVLLSAFDFIFYHVPCENQFERLDGVPEYKSQFSV